MQDVILPQLHGVVVVNKPAGMSSNRCLMQIKKMGQKKIGHAGTLDPIADGVLLVLLGQATKLSSYLLEEGGKIYRGTVKLGIETDTWDTEGRVLDEKSWSHVTPEDVRKAIAEWVSIKEQVVPPYSAAKKDGQPLYKLARKGTMVERTKKVTITEAEVLSCELPTVQFRVHCRSGTYIRSLAHSLGMRFSCGAVLTELTREYSYPFGLDVAHTLDEILENPGVLVHSLVPIRAALPSWPSLWVPEVWIDAVRTGQSIPASCFPKDVYKQLRPGSHAVLMNEECELALATLTSVGGGEPEWKVTRGLWGNG